MYSLGLDIGYSAVKISILTEKSELFFSAYRRHHGRISKTVLNLFSELSKVIDLNYVAFGAFTGRGIKFLLNNNNCFSEINIIAALVEGVKWDNGKTSSIIEIGGQSSKYIAGLRGEGSHITVESSSDCAAGTGSFLEEQISRFNYKIEDYSSLIEKA